MSLDFNLKTVADHVTVCFDGNGDLKPVTQELIWNCLRIEMGEITEDNADEFYARVQFMTALRGSMWQMPNGDLKITPEDVVAHIGLRTNVPTVHRQRWLTRSKGQVMGPLDEMRLPVRKLIAIDKIQENA